MEETRYRLSKENFHFLMDCINEYWDKSATPRNGLLYFIKDSLIAERVVTKYQPTTMEHLKGFFCNTVLDLHKGREEINIGEYEKFFDNRPGKKIAVFVDNMNRYLNRQANVQYVQEQFAADASLEAWEEVFPILLINRLQEVTHQCLKEYFLLDEEAFQKKKSMRLDRKKITDYETAKRKLYRRFVCAACLYEIFTDKFLGTEALENFYSVMDTILECGKRFQGMQVEFREQLGDWIKHKEEHGSMDKVAEEAKALTEKSKQFCEEMTLLMTKASDTMSRAYFYIVHIKYIIALYAIISMVEFTNVNTKDDVELPKKWKRPEMFAQMEAVFFESECDSLFIENISMNKNYCDVYGKVVDAIAEEKIIQELCSKSKKVQEEALALLYMYFAGVLSGADMKDADFNTALSLIFQKSLKNKPNAEI